MKAHNIFLISLESQRPHHGFLNVLLKVITLAIGFGTINKTYSTNNLYSNGLYPEKEAGDELVSSSVLFGR